MRNLRRRIANFITSALVSPWLLMAALLSIALGLAGIYLSNGADQRGQIDLPAVETTYTQPATEIVPGALDAINTRRALHDLGPVKLSNELNASSQAKADDLVANNYWSHFRDGRAPWDFIADAGYDYSNAGENLAKCWPDAEAIVEAWMDSPSHKAVLLGDYEDIGLGITKNNEDGCNYVVAHLGTKAVAAELPNTGAQR